jgi:hypothetical protein
MEDYIETCLEEEIDNLILEHEDLFKTELNTTKNTRHKLDMYLDTEYCNEGALSFHQNSGYRNILGDAITDYIKLL